MFASCYSVTTGQIKPQIPTRCSSPPRGLSREPPLSAPRRSITLCRGHSHERQLPSPQRSHTRCSRTTAPSRHSKTQSMKQEATQKVKTYQCFLFNCRNTLELRRKLWIFLPLHQLAVTFGVFRWVLKPNRTGFKSQLFNHQPEWPLANPLPEPWIFDQNIPQKAAHSFIQSINHSCIH